MSAKSFVDTNVLVYLFDGRVPAKQRRAAELLRQLADADDAPVISTQVLQEAFVALTRKLAMPAREAIGALQLLEAGSFAIQRVDPPLIWRAATRSADERLSFWDALIIEAAQEAGCTQLYSEDLQANRSFGEVTIRNPFV
ncbi:MAG: PIN domain-containing protein [Steroidobacteraceae bacterium]